MQFYPLTKAHLKASLFHEAFPNRSRPVTALQNPRAHTVYTNYISLADYTTLLIHSLVYPTKQSFLRQNYILYFIIFSQSPLLVYVQSSTKQ